MVFVAAGRALPVIALFEGVLETPSRETFFVDVFLAAFAAAGAEEAAAVAGGVIRMLRVVWVGRGWGGSWVRGRGRWVLRLRGRCGRYGVGSACGGVADLVGSAFAAALGWV